jgi:hypothetical protein
VTAQDIEIAVAKRIDCRRRLCVPNVSWGLGLSHECDILYVTDSGYAHEIEIKVSRADLLRDRKKDKFHRPKPSRMIRSLTYAIPAELESSVPDLLETAGVWIIEMGRKWDNTPSGVLVVRELRRAQANTSARKLTEKELMHLGHLAAMRMWDLKRNLSQMAREGNAK